MKLGLIGVLLFLILIIYILKTSYNLFSIYNKKTYREFYNVSVVIDGDTFLLDNTKKVRLIGINAPEKGEKCYEEAKMRLKELIENKTVKLEMDKKDKDKYNRLLRYVFVNESFINLLLVREGLAYVYIDFDNTKFLKELLNAQRYAKENKIGCLWNN